MFPDFNTFLPRGNASDRALEQGWRPFLPVPIDGRYLMYFGEGSIWYAWSDDLIHWTAVLERRADHEPDTAGHVRRVPGRGRARRRSSPTTV
ncbi:MAG: hypothetical protein WKF76_06100 [Nocardioidaceae bacterium]